MNAAHTSVIFTSLFLKYYWIGINISLWIDVIKTCQYLSPGQSQKNCRILYFWKKVLILKCFLFEIKYIEVVIYKSPHILPFIP